MVENVLAGFTTFAKTDSINMIKISLKIAHGFPEVLLKPDYLNKLLQTTIGKLVNLTIEGCKLLLPPADHFDPREKTKWILIELGIPFAVYAALMVKFKENKSRDLVIFLLAFKAVIILPQESGESAAMIS